MFARCLVQLSYSTHPSCHVTCHVTCPLSQNTALELAYSALLWPAERGERAFSFFLFVAMAPSSLLPHLLPSLEGFTVEALLNDGSEGGLVSVLGHWPDGKQALVKLSRAPIATDQLQLLLSGVQLQARAPYSGAEYGYYSGLERESPSLLVDVLAPHAVHDAADAADKILQKHVARSTSQASVLVRETPALYAASHAPLIAAAAPAALSWVHRILALEYEVERLLVDSPGAFLLNSDPKWSTHPRGDRASWRDHPAVRDLYCLAVVHRRDVASIRDLRAEHLPLLRVIRSEGMATIASVYGLPANQVRAFFHYPPQFYHLHVHFTALNVCVGHGCYAERAHLLDDVIANLEADGEYYAHRTLTVRVGVKDALLERYSEESL